MEFLFLLDDTSIQELMEIRLMVEPALAAKAAERATPEDIALLRQSIRDLEGSETNRVQLVSADLMFHRTIFRATGNRLSGRLFHIIHRAMLNMIKVTSQLVELEHTLQFHQAILEAIEQHDARRASSLMTDHLIDARDLVLRGQEREKTIKLHKHLRDVRVSHKTVTRAAVRSAKKSR
jgi:GntR family transcriptional repressor for pyruvate dehydrogenase complex